MTALDELRWLWRSFPNATEFAVSGEMMDRLDREMVATQRFVAHGDQPGIARMFDEEIFPTFTARRLSVAFRNARLTLVTPR